MIGVQGLLVLFIGVVDALQRGTGAPGADVGGDFLFETVVIVGQDLVLPAGAVDGRQDPGLVADAGHQAFSTENVMELALRADSGP